MTETYGTNPNMQYPPTEGGPPPYNPQYTNPVPPYNDNQQQPLMHGAPTKSVDYEQGSWQPDLQNKFPGTPPYRDIVWAIVFALHIVIVAGLLGYGHTLAHDGKDTGLIESVKIDGKQLVRILGSAVAIMLVVAGFSALYINLLRKYTYVMIITGIVLNCLLFFAMAAYNFIIKSYIVGAILIFIGLFMILMYWLWRSRIPFAVAVLRTVCGVVSAYPATQLSAFATLGVMAVYICLWVWTVAICQRFPSGVVSYVVAVYLIFSFYYCTQVIKNTLHVGVSGLYASWYFMAGSVGMPKNPTAASFKRALTTSFGSICFGSLIVAILKTIRTIVRFFRAKNNNIVLAIIACFADCILGCLDWLIQYFNHYAFTQVAIYGHSFCQAAKATWRLFKSDGLEAIVNDNIIDGVLSMGCLLGGIVGAITGGFMGLMLFDNFTTDTYWWAAFAIIGLAIGFVVMTQVIQIVDSGVATIFVCFAEDHVALQVNHPDLYQQFKVTYELNW